MYETMARLVILVALGYFSAHLVEWVTLLFAVFGADRYHLSVAFRTIGVICAYVVFREYVKGVWQRGWRSLFDLL